MNKTTRPQRPERGTTSTPTELHTRRTRRTLITAAFGAAAFTAPAHWSKPLIKAVILPAHAQTTGSPVVESPIVPFSDCAPQTLTDGTSVAFTLSEAVCSTSSNAVAFLGAACASGVTTLTIAPGVQWDYASSFPAGNPIVIAAGAGVIPVSFIVQQLVTGIFYRMQLSVTDNGTDCSLSEILIFGPFTTATEAA